LVQHTGWTSHWRYGELTVAWDPSLGAGAPETPAGAVKLLGFREKVWLSVLAELSGLEEICRMLTRHMLKDVSCRLQKLLLRVHRVWCWKV